jgi:hypothetical protein
MKNCLLLGRKETIVESVKEGIENREIKLFGGTSLQDVKDMLVIMGAGIDIAVRLDIIRYIYETSNSTSVHMKDWDSGPAGMLPFVNAALNGV